jgi:membrane-associated phospholipid phosphatase
MSKARQLVRQFPEVALVILLIAVDLMLAARSHITFQHFGPLLIPVFVLVAVWLWYAKRNVARLSDLAYYPLLLLLSGVSGMVLSYLAVDPALPVYDDALVRIDAMLFFHWPDWLAFYRSHPLYLRVLQFAYDSWGVQLYGSAIFFALSGKRSRNRELLRIAIVSSVITVAIFHSFPALGPFFYFKVGPALESLLHMPFLRGGRPLTLAPLDLQGLISFPSFHTVMALAFIYVHRGQGALTLIVTALNVAMLLATIVCGAHYLIDLLGGAMVTSLSIALVRRTVGAQPERQATISVAQPDPS